MSTSELSDPWVDAQLRDAEVPQPVATAVKRLLAVWRTMNHTDVTAEQTLAAFGKLALGHTLPLPREEAEVWTKAHRGMLTVRDEVRVASNAYSGAVGQAHNGRRGRIVAIRSGDIFVLYEGSKAEASVRHPPEKLEKRVR